MLRDCMTYDMNMTLLWWMDVAKGRYQFISSSWGFLNMVTPWFVSNIGNTSIWIQMSLKRIFQIFRPQVQNIYFVEHVSMVAYDKILGKNIMSFLDKF